MISRFPAGRVLAAMSGGVDSSVAAYLLREQGYEVIGVTMQIWPRDADFAPASGGCCGIDAIEDARKVASRLGMPHYTVNLREVFADTVIADFCREYVRGRTPNPCIRCNSFIKFGALLDKARELNAAYIATGHYARVERRGDRFLLKKGADRAKDQSYFLYGLTQEQLGRALMPVGGLDKTRVRDIAGALGLAVARKKESQEICFVPGNDYRVFLRSRLANSPSPGPIVDRRGRVLGTHDGIMFYTVGQRRSLGLSSRERLYVIAIRPDENTIVVGAREEAYSKQLTAADLNWISLEGLAQAIEVKARIRHRQKESPARVTPLAGGRVRVDFAEKQLAITPGQAVVFYDGDIVVGGGTIERGEEDA
ncbi:MAG: tRNA 2-thiouridine(34) synthase MnmA [Chloroflexi bacterium]|nr:tRNA 2-thiouridine(34) synthase MnmA [Chloroflexota bacterium]